MLRSWRRTCIVHVWGGQVRFNAVSIRSPRASGAMPKGRGARAQAKPSTEREGQQVR
jgi:hypothetical protein